MDTITIPQQAEMTIKISDVSIINDVRRILKRINGVESITVKKTKSEVELSLDEAHKGKVTHWDSVEDYFNTMLSK
ncbi:MAG: hypothetical protein MJZ73_02245 [Bacteroidaceae bacterium]|nr:hypothetical protein [Bacteroidaceae bacterium]